MIRIFGGGFTGQLVHLTNNGGPKFTNITLATEMKLVMVRDVDVHRYQELRGKCKLPTNYCAHGWCYCDKFPEHTQKF